MSNHDNLVCPTFAVKHAAVSDMGMRRANNQDSLATFVTQDVATWATRGHLLMVADGMGAHAAGELASKLAVDHISHNYFKLRELYPPAALRQAIRDANNAIHAKGQSSIGFQGMGTTCSCLVLLPQGALVAHIGDSRVYRLRGDFLEQLTFDHSLVWEMAAAGQMSESEVPSYIPKNVITRSLGPHATVHVDLEGPFNAQTGDKFLICSDGLSGPVNDEELGIILRCLDPKEAAETLVDLANLRGGPDNISVVIAEVDGAVPRETAIESSSDLVPGPRRGNTAPLWLAAGACLAILIYCLKYEFWAGAIGSGVGLLAAVGAGLAFRSRSLVPCPPIGPIGGPYGNGPYRKANCTPNAKVVTSLADLSTKLRELPEKNASDRKPDWNAFDKSSAEAKSASDRGDYPAAVRNYSAAIRGMMKQLREHRPTVDSDAKAI
ncbi:MAG TPA: PP2C family serine/threonine-protein phosphatase [Lacipirellulaceae bacterium]|jgi:protein phosphatase|nr:PP2C family serine/threonine-protein phosphatase [Lacipirellulaceae bacterium]